MYMLFIVPHVLESWYCIYTTVPHVSEREGYILLISIFHRHLPTMYTLSKYYIQNVWVTTWHLDSEIPYRVCQTTIEVYLLLYHLR